MLNIPPDYSIIDGYIIYYNEDTKLYTITDEVEFIEYYDSYSEAVKRISELSNL